jgi:S1-C subfamily serine protease
MSVDILRTNQKLAFTVPVTPQKHDVDRMLDMVDPEKNLVRKIGILATDVDERISSILPDLRIKSGAVVVANTAYSRAVDVGLRPGDVIHALNTKPITNLADLQREIGAANAGSAVVLQVERADGMDYVAFQME